VQTASDHQEYAARTLRPKIRQQLSHFLRPLQKTVLRKKCSAALSRKLQIKGLDWRRGAELLHGVVMDRTVGPAPGWRGGRAAALKRLKKFFSGSLPRYGVWRNFPTRDVLSGLSPYLHFGHISALEIVMILQKQLSKAAVAFSKEEMAVYNASLEAFLEELIVRRELVINFCHYNHGYDQYNRAVPGWARESLAKHAADPRPRLYTLRQLEKAATDDQIWNACQREMVMAGKMHGYMRMYWGKKIIEWTRSPEEAFERMLLLNNKYELDGRDPNSFAGVAWCFGKHDRPWGPERPIFGLVRYMNAAGIKRKIKDWPLYVQKWYNEKKTKT
jgi:deoxyribodipyrimidine photo-lyase